MVRVYFKDSFGNEGMTEWLSKLPINNGKSVSFFLNGKFFPNQGYLLFQKEESYIDLCNPVEEDEFESVYDHCPIINIRFSGYEPMFVEQYHPDYNCDKIAWLNDAYCALDSETDNASHWKYLANLCDGWEKEYCEAIYNAMVNNTCDEGEIEAQLKYEGITTIESFGLYLSSKYARYIKLDILGWEESIMEEAKKNFFNQFNIKYED